MDDETPTFEIPSDWTAIRPPDAWNPQSFVYGDPDKNRLRVAYFLRETDGATLARVWFGPGAGGPPGHAHGGAIAAILDEIMGVATWKAGYATVAATLTIRLVKPTPLCMDTVAAARLGEIRGRKIIVTSRLTDLSGDTVFAEAEGLFIKLTQAQLQAFGEHAGPY